MSVFLLSSILNTVYSQSNINLTWDSSVGCVEYDDNVDEFGVLVPIEEISEEVCIKFCENTEVTFSLSDPDGNIDSILWDQAGGITSSANQNPDFTVVWNNVANSGNISVQVTLLDGTIIRKAICVEVIVTPVPNLGGIIITPDSCNPYAVTLSVQSPQAGTYHWSDGFTGYPHTVTRGGSYQLTFVPDNSACTVELQTYLDKDPSSYLWYFPSGCLDFCGKEDFATRVIPGLSVRVDRDTFYLF